MTKTKIAILILVMFAASFIGRVGGALLEHRMFTTSGETNGNPYAAVCWTTSKVFVEKEQP